MKFLFGRVAVACFFVGALSASAIASAPPGTSPPPTPPPSSPPPGQVAPPPPAPPAHAAPAKKKPSRIELATTFGYRLNTVVRGWNADFCLENGLTYQVSAALRLAPTLLIELSYMGSNSSLDLSNGVKTGVQVGFNSIHVGVVHELKPGPIRPFWAAGIGGSWMNFSGTESFTEGALSAHLELGLKIFLHKMVGLKFSARAVMPMLFNGVGVGCGVGGCGGGLTFHVPFVSFDFAGGVVLRF